MSADLADFLVFGPVGALTDGLVNNLTARGLQVIQHSDDPTQVRRCACVIWLPGLGDCSTAPTDLATLFDQQGTWARQLIQSTRQQGCPLLLVENAADSDGLADDDPRQQAWRLVSAQIALMVRSGATAEGIVFAQARLFGVYAPDCHRWGIRSLVGRLLGDLLAGKPLALADEGAAVRSFCALDDAIEALARLAIGLTSEASYRGHCVDIGHPHPITVAEFARALIRLSGHAAGMRTATDAELSDTPPVSPLLPDISQLEQAVGYRSTTAIETGLQRILAALGRLAEPAADRDGERPALVGNIRPYFEVDARLTARIGHILISGQATNGGRYQRELEARLADWLGVEELAVLSNGADALLAVLATAPPAPGSKAILPSYTFIATLNAVLAQGLEPVFCDIDPHTFTLCPQALTRLLASTSDVAWVIPVNVFGVPAQIATITQLSEAAGARVLYDNCHGLGTEQTGRRMLDGPLAQTISLHATKVLPGVEAGLVLSPDSELLARVRQWRNHGIAADPLCSIPGCNAKLDEVRAAIALAELDHLDAAIARRRDYGERLRGFIAQAGLAQIYQLQRIPAEVRSNFQNHGVLCPAALKRGRDAIIQTLIAHGIGARPYFHPALHRLERYHDQDFDLPVTEQVWSSWICLPLHARMSERDLATIEQGLLAVAERIAAES